MSPKRPDVIPFWILDFAESGGQCVEPVAPVIATVRWRNYRVGVPPTLAQLSKTDFGLRWEVRDVVLHLYYSICLNQY